MEHPISEDMPALGIRAKLRFIQSGKRELPFHRHRFGGAKIPARARRFDPFLPSYQRHFLGPFDRDHTIVNLPRQQAQRKAHHTARMRAEPFDGEVRLAGVGGPKHGLYGIFGGGHYRACLSAPFPRG